MFELRDLFAENNKNFLPYIVKYIKKCQGFFDKISLTNRV